MKKIYAILGIVLLTTSCSHVSEEIIGNNQEGMTIVRVCKSRGNLVNPVAFGSSCFIETRDYGRISNKTNTINIISDDDR